MRVNRSTYAENNSWLVVAVNNVGHAPPAGRLQDRPENAVSDAPGQMALFWLIKELMALHPEVSPST